MTSKQYFNKALEALEAKMVSGTGFNELSEVEVGLVQAYQVIKEEGLGEFIIYERFNDYWSKKDLADLREALKSCHIEYVAYTRGQQRDLEQYKNSGFKVAGPYKKNHENGYWLEV